MSEATIFFSVCGFFCLCVALAAWHDACVTKPSDGLVGLICGELRSGAEGWRYYTDILDYSYRKGDTCVSYRELFEARVYLTIDGQNIELSPSSAAALMKIVRKLKKQRDMAAKAEADTRALMAIVRKSEEMLH